MSFNIIIYKSFLGRGTPCIIKERTNRLVPIQELELPDSSEAKILYETSYNGRLRSDTQFGIDMLEGNQQLVNFRDVRFNQQFNVSNVFCETVNGNTRLLQDLILYFIHITEDLHSRV